MKRTANVLTQRLVQLVRQKVIPTSQVFAGDVALRCSRKTAVEWDEQDPSDLAMPWNYFYGGLEHFQAK